MNNIFRPTRALFIVAALLLLAASACSSSTPTTVEQDPQQVLDTPKSNDFDRLIQAAEESYSDRVDREKADQAIELWTEAAQLESIQDDKEALAEVYESLANAYYFVARYHEYLAPNSDRERILLASGRGVEFAGKAVEIRAPEFHRSITRGAPFETELEDAPPEAISALLPYARNLDLWSHTEGVSATVESESIVDSIMEFVIEHDADAHFAAAHRHFGSRWIERAFHRSPEKSAESFANSLAREPDFLITRVLRARNLATAIGDRALYESDLRHVINADEDALPQARAENIFAQQLAEKLLADVDQYF